MLPSSSWLSVLRQQEPGHPLFTRSGIDPVIEHLHHALAHLDQPSELAYVLQVVPDGGEEPLAEWPGAVQLGEPIHE